MAHPADEQPLPLAAGEHPPVPGAVKVSSVDMADAHHSTRTKARKAALDVLFESDLLGQDASVSLAERLSDPEITVREVTREIVLGVRDNAIEIDRRIATLTTSQWPIDRMPRIDRCLARMAIYELDYTGIDARAAISEALELADELSTDDSVAFLNGLLGRAAQTRPGRKADGEQ